MVIDKYKNNKALFHTVDGKDIVGKYADKQNRLVYVLKDKTGHIYESLSGKNPSFEIAKTKPYIKTVIVKNN